MASEESPVTFEHGKPSKGMMCLCTMEDITEEDENYEIQCFGQAEMEYQSYPSGIWKPALFEACIVEDLLKTQFEKYIARVKTSDCQAELKRLLTRGPPIYIEDKHALPLAKDDDTHISTLWFAKEANREISAKLDGALEGQERDDLWEELKKFVIVEGKEEGDDIDEEEQQDNIVD